MRSRTQYNPQGFTLIELILVLTLISVLAAVQLPMLSRTHGKATLHSEATTLRRFLLATRAKALMERREARWYVDHDAKGYRLEEQADPVNAPSSFVSPATGPLAERVKLISTIHLSKNTSMLQFSASGSLPDATITLRDASGLSAQLILDGVSDSIRIEYDDTTR